MESTNRLQIGAWLDFLRHRTDAWIFQDQSVVEITEATGRDGRVKVQLHWQRGADSSHRLSHPVSDNAPVSLPGSQQQGELEGHAHTATLSGFKSQSLDASQAGGGAYNQLVFDDTPGQGRVLAHTTQSQTWLQIGHLLQQNDNQRLARRGHGLELHTQAQGAVRAASGLHISTHARTPTPKSATLPETPGRFAVINPFEGSKFAMLAGGAGSLGL